MIVYKKGDNMKKIFIILSISLLCGACATPYKAASKPTSNGYFDTLLQTGVYDITFNANGETAIKRAQDFALLRAAEVCLENGYQSFSVINSSNNSKTETDVVTNTNTYNSNYSYSYSYVVSETKPRVSIMIQCSSEMNLFFNAENIRENLRKKYKIK